MRAISLFSGIGGIDIALEQCGIEIVAMCEKDEWCRGLLSKRFDAPIHEDVLSFPSEEYVGDVDIVVGGFPCQPVSVAGKQRGDKDERWLWGSMFNIIKTTKPTWVLGENVKGLLNKGIETIISDLQGEGYETTVCLLPATAIGAVHQRERVFILGYSKERHIANTTGNGCNGGKKRGSCTQTNERTEEGKNKTERTEGCSGVWPVLSTTPIAEGWATIPDICRVDDGVSRRLDKVRLKALGNAVVPQQVMPFIKFIVENN